MKDREKKLETTEELEKMDLNELDQISGGSLDNVKKEDLEPIDPNTAGNV